MDIVTGARGFLGRHLTERLNEFISIPHEELDTYFPGDFQHFYYLASYGNLYHQKDVNETIKANLLTPYRIAECSTNPFKSFTYISTSSVNLPEQTTYSLCKLACEQLIMELEGPYSIIRPYSITGVGEQPEHLIPTLIDAAYTGKVIPFVPEPTHDFVDVEDVVDAILMVSKLGLRGVFEVGRGEAVSNAEVKWVVETITGRKIKTRKVKSMRSYDTKNWKCEDTMLKEMGWEPKKKLVHSITQMVEVYESVA
jgi:nucleoside-diphosphate-sugar epimerase